MIILVSGINYSFSKNTLLLKFSSNVDGENNDTYRVATYDIQIDGRPTNVLDFNTYATTKLSDITRTENGYNPNSFLEDAYQKHKITVTNNSETVVTCDLTTVLSKNDDRVFYTVISSDADHLLENLYTDEDISTPAKVREYLADKTIQTATFNIGESKDFMMIVWSEHDAVFPDSNSDGTADTPTEYLADLTNGVPSETFLLNYQFTQKD